MPYNKKMQTGEIKTVTNKLSIQSKKDTYNIYITTSIPPDLMYLDVRLSGMFGPSARALVEIFCRYAIKMLAANLLTLDALIIDCRGAMEFEPHGPCLELARLEGDDSRPVKSVLDLVGRFLLQKFAKNI